MMTNLDKKEESKADLIRRHKKILQTVLSEPAIIFCSALQAGSLLVGD